MVLWIVSSSSLCPAGFPNISFISLAFSSSRASVLSLLPSSVIGRLNLGPIPSMSATCSGMLCFV